MILLGLAVNLWLAGWWVVALVGSRPLLPLGAACAAVLAAYLLTLGLDPEAVALSPFGPSQAGRFYGVSNLLETMLLVPALLGVALLGRLALAVAALALVAVGGSRFGADGGGLLVLLAAYGTLLVRRVACRSGRRTVAIAVSRGRGVRSARRARCCLRRLEPRHEALGDGRVRCSATSPTGSALGPANLQRGRPGLRRARVLAVLIFVATRRPRLPLTDAVLVALLVSLVVNDTPGDVLGMGAVAAFVVRRFEDGSTARAPSRLVRLRAMRRPLTVLALLLAALALVAAGCGGDDVSATPETIEGKIPEETTTGGGTRTSRPRPDGRRGRRRVRVRERRLRRLPHALGRRHERHGRPEPRRRTALVRAGRRAHHARSRRHALVRRTARAPADRRRRGVRLLVGRRLSLLPDRFRGPVEAFACDLDGTLIGRDTVLRPRTRAAIVRARRPPGSASSS